MPRLPLVGLSLMLEPDFALASEPLFDSGEGISGRRSILDHALADKKREIRWQGLL